MSARIEFFFDLSSPWTRLAFHNIQPIAEEAETSIIWRPFLVGGVFNAVNQSVYEARSNPADPKMRQSFNWLLQWAELAGLPMNFPSEHHPVKSVWAMRVCCALEGDQDALFKFCEHAFHGYFADQRNLDDPEVLRAIADEAGLDGGALQAAAQSQKVKDALRRNTDEAIARGSFGSPTIFVDGEHLYFGNDQLPLVRQRLLES